MFGIILAIVYLFLYIISLTILGGGLNYIIDKLYNQIQNKQIFIKLLVLLIGLYGVTLIHFVNTALSKLIYGNIVNKINNTIWESNKIELPNEIKSPIITSLVLFSTQIRSREIINEFIRELNLI